MEVARSPGHPQGTSPSSHRLTRLSSSSQGEGSVYRSSPSTTPRTPQRLKASSSPMRSQLARRSQASSTASLESKAERPLRSSSSPSLESKAARPPRASSSNSLQSQAARQPLMSSSASLKSLEESSWHLKDSSSPSLEALFDALERPSISSPSPRARRRPSSSRSSPKIGQPSRTSPQAPKRTRPRFEPTPSQGELSRYFSADPVVTLPDEALTFDEFGGSDHSSK